MATRCKYSTRLGPDTDHVRVQSRPPAVGRAPSAQAAPGTPSIWADLAAVTHSCQTPATTAIVPDVAPERAMPDEEAPPRMVFDERHGI